MEAMIKLYHGGTVVIEKPDCTIGRDNLDFGKGFYLTALSVQAERWASRLSSDRGGKGIVNEYQLDRDVILKRYKCLIFTAYDRNWLEFIVSSRAGCQPWAGYDYIEGGVANDRVIDTVNLYSLGLMSAETALTELSKHRPNNQACILAQEIADKYLKFVGSYECE